ncbi:hypothetical protein ACFX2I_042555 [Malus domestica]
MCCTEGVCSFTSSLQLHHHTSTSPFFSTCREVRELDHESVQYENKLQMLKVIRSILDSNGDGKVSDIKAAPLFSCILLRLLPRSCQQLQRPLSND